MAQNEMEAKPALPERVRSMEGLGVAARRARAGAAVQAIAKVVPRLGSELFMMLSEELQQ